MLFKIDTSFFAERHFAALRFDFADAMLPLITLSLSAAYRTVCDYHAAFAAAYAL